VEKNLLDTKMEIATLKEINDNNSVSIKNLLSEKTKLSEDLEN